MTNRRIAERMGVSLDAVKFHVANALSKLGFTGRQELRLWDGVAKGTALHQMRRSIVDAVTTSDSYMIRSFKPYRAKPTAYRGCSCLHALTLTFVPVADHAHHDPDDLAQGFGGRSEPGLQDALADLPSPRLIAGSLYLAGEALAANGEVPD